MKYYVFSKMPHGVKGFDIVFTSLDALIDYCDKCGIEPDDGRREFDMSDLTDIDLLDKDINDYGVI